MKVFVLFFLLLFSFAQAQNIDKIDSLLLNLEKSKTDSSKVNVFADLCWEYQSSDSSKALQYSKEGLELAKKIKYKKGIALCYNYIGNVYYFYCKFPLAIDYYEKSLNLYKELRDKKGISGCYHNIANLHKEQGNYLDAIRYYTLSLKIYNDLNDNKGKAICYNNIGIIYEYQGDYSKAIEYYQKSLKIKETINDKGGIAQCYLNIGIVHSEQGEYTQALEYYNDALKIVQAIDDKKGLSQCYNNIGNIYNYQGDYENAISSYQKAFEIKRDIGDLKGMAGCYNNIGASYFYMNDIPHSIDFFVKSLEINKKLGDKNGISGNYVNISGLKIRNGDYYDAINYAQKGLDIAKEIGLLQMERECYQNLSEANDSIRNIPVAYKYFKLFKAINDSIYNRENSKQIKEMEARYQNERKEKEIELLNKDKEKQAAVSKAESNKQKVIIYSVLSVLILVIAFAVFAYRSYLHKRKANVLLAMQKVEIEEKNEELNQQNEEIAAQRDELQTQRDIVVKQRDHIEEIHQELTDSIQYAKRIQNAVLPASDYIAGLLNEKLKMDYFTIFRPRDIVSGDFYFIDKRKNMLFLAVADCTGHGVPGAFMSMLGISFLQEIIAKEYIQSPAHVLNELRDYIIKSLQHKGSDHRPEQFSVRDGMDISLIAINTTQNVIPNPVFRDEESINPDIDSSSPPIGGLLRMTYTAKWAGANNPLWIIRNNPKSLQGIQTLEGVEPELEELKGDKMPISIYERMDDFTNHELVLNSGDTIYLMSDGFEDQFGGPKGKKFKSKQLKKLICETSEFSLDKQKQKIESTLDNWQKAGESFEQTDDITLMGIKIA